MRIGSNPNKNTEIKQSSYNHQIIIPVNIPHFNTYFENSFAVLKLCLESLFKTTHNNVYITIVDNGSCEKVKKYLDELYYGKKINEVIHTTKIGKVNSILKGIVGHNFKYITISDSDVLFLNNWQKATYEIFNSYKKVGVVGLTPILKSTYSLTSNVLISNLFSKNLLYSKVKDEEAMFLFHKSIGKEDYFQSIKDKRYFVLNKNNVKACVGSGHYVATYKSDIFETISMNSRYKMSKGLKEHIDDKSIKKGYWRLTTHDNFAYHMGNNDENWMIDALDNLKLETNQSIDTNNEFKKKKVNIIICNLGFNKLASQLFKIIKFRRIFEKMKKD